jgi:Methylamine utilisation protein MauE
MTVDPVVLYCVRGATALLFLSAAGEKLLDWRRFMVVLEGYGIHPRWISVVAATVIALELCAGSGVLAGIAASSLLAVGLLLGCAARMAIGLARGERRADCGCARRAQPVSTALVIRNVAIAPFVLLGALPAASRALGALDYVYIGAGIVFASIVYAAANELIAARDRLEEWV